MAGDWIKFELTTLDKPEVCQIADLADIDPDAVVGKLMRVWGWFDQQTEDGNAPSVSKKLLDRLVGVTGFCEHMKSVNWMAEADGLISLPRFDRHNGRTAKNRLAHLPCGQKGVGMKSPDQMAVFACHHCHTVIDGALRWEVPAADYLRALAETQLIWIKQGLMRVQGVAA